MKHHPDIFRTENADKLLAPLTVQMNAASDNPNVIVQGPFFRVSGDESRVPIDDYFKHGYETQREFREAADALISRWRNREGECVEKRLYHGLNDDGIDENLTILRLRFHDTPGCRPDEAWIPCYLADQIPVPEYTKCQILTPYEQIMKEITDFIMCGKDKEHERHHRQRNR
jgi:hypothetical protein